ncbi:MAG: biotin-dependent carboxyltransferase family protein [Arenimonas sp.]|nr:biotin-dependent carboxyltransferase family protein [Arenimonas sp.]
MILFESAGLCCLQDLGRFGYQHLGISPSGAMDAFAARVANALLANDGNEGLLEILPSNTRLRLQRAQWFALTGADLSARLNGQPMPLCQPVWIEAGSLLEFGRAVHGCRAYLAVQGGFHAIPVLGSVATDLRAGLGGWHGRWFQKDDCLPLRGKPAHTGKPIRWHTSFANPAFADDEPLLVVPGAHWPALSPSQQEYFQTAGWMVSKDADRMGLRLLQALPDPMYSESMLSGPVTFGSIQLPPDNRPIILAADRQTTGGYPLLGTLASVSHARLAQCKPGDTLHFSCVDLQAAQNRLLAREKHFMEWRTHMHNWWRNTDG